MAEPSPSTMDPQSQPRNPSSSNPTIPSPSPISQQQQQQSPSIHMSSSSPSLPPLPQISQDQQQSQSHVQGINISPNSFQLQQTLQRSPSMSRLNQIQPQQQQVARQQPGLYGAQMNFGGSVAASGQQQQQQLAGGIGVGVGGGSNLSRSALIGQSSHFPMLSGAGAAAQFNLLSSVNLN